MPSESPEVARPNNRAGTIGATRLAGLVTERDLEILRSVEEHRLLTTRHLYDLHFWNHATWASGIRACNRVLGRLRDHRLLRRLDRPVGGQGGGSQSYVWALDVAGDRLLRQETGDGKRRRPFEPSAMFLNHTLAIADVRVQIEVAAREGKFELVSTTTEPNNWRPFGGLHSQVQRLKPDLEVTTASGDWEHDWFFEIDLGTESGPALVKKCRIYIAYFKTGREQHERGTFPRVIWLMTNQRRTALLERLLTSEKPPPGIFTIITIDRLVPLLQRPDETDTSAPSPATDTDPERGTGSHEVARPTN